ncbi:MAG: Unknown protein [uncultured Sulfurovum sp.]|uniref:Uncharacterized protein n=1 Tax=uncultured Sulfurovum sp. TaxID=269237 RepID=A0A6S6S6K4_9BACT|nr:MAG: Unknown protein [uncultured Sulfurovum sp.]
MKQKHIQTKYIDRLYKKMMTDADFKDDTLRVVFGKGQPTEIVIANPQGEIYLNIIDKDKDFNSLAEEVLEMLES